MLSTKIPSGSIETSTSHLIRIGSQELRTIGSWVDINSRDQLLLLTRPPSQESLSKECMLTDTPTGPEARPGDAPVN